MMSELFDRIRAYEKADALVEPAKRRFVIKLTLPGGAEVYAGENNKWFMRKDHAKAFEFVVIAEGFAIMELELSPLTYTVEAL